MLRGALWVLCGGVLWCVVVWCAVRTLCSSPHTGISNSACDQSVTTFTFSGADAIGLFHNSVLIDLVGARTLLPASTPALLSPARFV
jgi:hypothetical protein